MHHATETVHWLFFIHAGIRSGNTLKEMSNINDARFSVLEILTSNIEFVWGGRGGGEHMYAFPDGPFPLKVQARSEQETSNGQ
jgi:hypothetical protein